MKFSKIEVDGAYEITLEKKGDERGFFARGYCEDEMRDHGISFHMIQANIGFNKFQNTLRGLHYQIGSHAEKKLVKCVKGSIYDVVVDLRPNSSTYGHWAGRKLTADNHAMLFIPEGCAHGYQTLADNSEISYMVSAHYEPKAERGILWNDPAFNIKWKYSEDIILSDKDKNWPAFTS
ncbi:MAG: dTDP-4-dehydrorhamnose 3,5-epimerase [Balneolales bacterium]